MLKEQIGYYQEMTVKKHSWKDYKKNQIIMKKYPYDSLETLTVLINKMLEKYNIDIDYVINNPNIENVPWYQYYTFTKEEHDQWEEFFYKSCY